MTIASWRYTFTVFTPTHNRAHTLPRVYESLQKQTFRDFEWLIVDDGSTDGTKELVASWQQTADFPMRYQWQGNAGKHVAFNRGVELAEGNLFLTFDSDDACVPHALERFKTCWEAIPVGDRASFSAVSALCADQQGRIIGDAFPAAVFDSDPLAIQARHGVRGDKWGFQRTDVLRQFPFPTFPGEKFLAEGILWHRIGRRYKARFINEPLQIKEYLSEGLSAASVRLRARNPLGTRLLYKESAQAAGSLRWRVRNLINYIRFSLHGKIGTYPLVLDSGAPLLATALLPVGYLAYRRDRAWILNCSS